MGCVASRIDQEGRVQICKERKKLMKQLVGYRGEFANAQLAYLRALKNTGVTLRQITESDSLEPLELENTSYGPTLPPSPPLPLPPSPPPPPSFSPDSRKAADKGKGEEENIEFNQDDCSTPPSSNAKGSSWAYWNVFGSTSPLGSPKQSKTIEHDGEDNGVESKMELEVEGRGEELVENSVISSLTEKPQSGEIVDDNSSMTSWCNKDSSDVAMVVWKNKKTLEGIIRELDDYFLKASAGGKEIAVFTDINIGENSVPWKRKENKGKQTFQQFVVHAYLFLCLLSA